RVCAPAGSGHRRPGRNPRANTEASGRPRARAVGFAISHLPSHTPRTLRAPGFRAGPLVSDRTTGFFGHAGGFPRVPTMLKPWLREWFDRSIRHGGPSRTGRSPRPSPLLRPVEQLEDRSVPSVVTWDGAPDAGGTSPDGNWSTASNWVGDVA